MALLKRKSFQRDTGKMDEESYQAYLKSARPSTAELEISEKDRELLSTKTKKK